MAPIQIRKPKGATRRRKIVGRGAGSGHGSTAGRGTKGQGARSGGGPRPGFEGGQMPLFRRIARRGFSNQPFKETFDVVNVEHLNRFSDGAEVDAAALGRAGLVSGRRPVKILGDGELKRTLTVRVARASRSAKDKIEALKGTFEMPAPAAAKQGAASGRGHRRKPAKEAAEPALEAASGGGTAKGET